MYFSETPNLSVFSFLFSPFVANVFLDSPNNKKRQGQFSNKSAEDDETLIGSEDKERVDYEAIDILEDEVKSKSK